MHLGCWRNKRHRPSWSKKKKKKGNLLLGGALLCSKCPTRRAACTYPRLLVTIHAPCVLWATLLTHTLPGIIGSGLWRRRHTRWGWYESHNSVVKSTKTLLQMGVILSKFLSCNFRLGMLKGACKTFARLCSLRIVK